MRRRLRPHDRYLESPSEEAFLAILPRETKFDDVEKTLAKGLRRLRQGKANHLALAGCCIALGRCSEADHWLKRHMAAHPTPTTISPHCILTGMRLGILMMSAPTFNYFSRLYETLLPQPIDTRIECVGLRVTAAIEIGTATEQATILAERFFATEGRIPPPVIARSLEAAVAARRPDLVHRVISLAAVASISMADFSKTQVLRLQRRHLLDILSKVGGRQ